MAAAFFFVFSAPALGAVCQQDAKVCPDGSIVMREGSNCTFPACPSGPPDTGGFACNRDLKTCPDGTKLSRDASNGCRFPACPGTIACPQDAKVCPDGTTLVRDPKNLCKFPACPIQTTCNGDVKICADGTRVRRDPDRECRFRPCPTTGSRTQTVITTSTRTRTRTRTETETTIRTSTAVDLNGEEPDGSGQSVAFCNMAAVSAMSSILHLDGGQRDQSLAAYQNAEEQVRRAKGLDSSCPVPSGASILDEEQLSPLASRFEQAAGVPRAEVYSQVHDMAVKAAGSEAPSVLDGLLGFIGKFPDENTQERLKSILAAEGGGPSAPPQDGQKTEGEAAVAKGGAPAPAPVPEFPVSTAPAVQEKPAAPKPLSREERALLEKKSRIIEEIRDRELKELDAIIASNEEQSYDSNQADVSVFQRVGRVYRKVEGGMSRPSVTGIERPKKNR